MESFLYSVIPKQSGSTRSIPVMAAWVHPLIIAEYRGHLAVPFSDTALPVRDGPKLLDTEVIGNIPGHFCRKRAFAHTGRVGFEYHNHIIDPGRPDPVVCRNLGCRRVFACDKGIRSVIERDAKSLCSLEEHTSLP